MKIKCELIKQNEELGKVNALDKLISTIKSLNSNSQLYKEYINTLEICKLRYTVSYLTKEMEKYKCREEKEYKEVVQALKGRIIDCNDQLQILVLSKFINMPIQV